MIYPLSRLLARRPASDAAGERSSAGIVFATGTAVSLLAIFGMALAIYFAGSAPHLPASAVALENLKVRGQDSEPIRPVAIDKPAPAPTSSQITTRLAPLLGSAPGSTPIDAAELPPLEPAQ